MFRVRSSLAQDFEQTLFCPLLREKGFRLGRPEVDTLEGSKHANMKELRVKVLKVQWRFAFAFDPARKAVVLRWREERCEPETLLQTPD